MKQKLILLALVIGLTVVSQSTLSLGMGNIQVYSSLDEPLSATIELLTSPEEDLQNLTVKLATDADYKKVGLDRSFVPANIQVNLDEENPYIIKVTSNGPVSEPIISLLLDVDWNNGRILREFTVLLDPPVYDVPSSQVQVNNFVTDTVKEQAVEEPELQARETTETEVPQSVYTNEDVTQYDEPSDASMTEETSYSMEPRNNEVTVNAGDTLWRIANENKLGGLSANQMMIAIYNNNPAAFIDNNINKMIKGSLLTMPSLAQAEAISYNDALQEVQSHNLSWTPAETDYSSYQTADDDTYDYNDSSSTLDYGVELSGGDSEGSDNGQTNAEAGDNENAQLSAEELYNQEAQNQDLQERITDLEEIVEQQQSILDIEDTSLANLESQLEEANDAVTDETMSDDVWDIEVDDLTEGLDADVAAVEATEENGITDDMVDAADETTVEEDEATDVAQQVVETTEPATQEKNIPQFGGSTQPEESLVDKTVNWVMSNLQWVLIGLGGLVLLLLVPKFLRRGSADEEETSFLDDIKQKKTDVEDDGFDDSEEEAFLAESADTKINPPLEEEDVFASDESDAEDVLAELDKSIVFDDDTPNSVEEAEEDDPFEGKDNDLLVSDDDDGFDLDGFLNDEEPSNSDDSVTADHSETLAGVDFGDDDSDSDFEDVSFDDLGMDLDEDSLKEEKADESGEDDLLSDMEELKEDVEDTLSGSVDSDDELEDFDLDSFDLDDLDADELNDTNDSESSNDTDDESMDLDADTDAEESVELDEDFDFDLDLDEVSEDTDDTVEAVADTVDSDDTDDFDDFLDLSDDEETFTTEEDGAMDEEIDLGLDSLMEDGDAIDTKLDLAKAYLDMGDYDGAKNLLEEVMSEGTADQKDQAKKILDDM